jgi:peptidoglycan/LPS O-acetylase OafA/YrhL
MTELAHRPDIDGLRAVAILGVLAYHARLPGVSGGFLGVDVFFVISGFLITGLLYRELRETNRISLSRFYARRARRILPALISVIVATLITCRYLLPPTERQETIESALSALAFVANHFFWANTDGYFDGSSELMPLLHLWSLAVEEQFYLLWPMLLIALGFSARDKRRQSARSVVLLLGLASFAYCIWLRRIDPSAAFFIAPARAWE